MLVELDIRDFAIIERVRIELSDGFNVLTGETGAGKSILIDAVGLLLGERADTTLVRSGAERALIQGIFATEELGEGAAGVLAEYGVEPEAQLIIDREVLAAGRSTARVNGRVVPAKALSDLGRFLIDLHGQTETASLLREPEHLRLLDRFAGLDGLKARVAEEVAALERVTGAMTRLRRDEAELARRVDMLQYQIREIEAARLTGDEEAELLTARTRLGNAERLAGLADRAYSALHGDGDENPGGLDGVGQALQAVEDLAAIDEGLAAALESLREAEVVLHDLASALRDYRDAVEFDPERLERVEDRLAAIGDLKRKYGDSVAGILAYADEARRELDGIEGAEEQLERLAAERDTHLAAIAALAGELSEARQKAANRLEPAVAGEMGELGMPESSFEVRLERRAHPEGVAYDGGTWAFDQTGIDQVWFEVTTNPGEPARPLVKVASGGETARMMLALKSVLRSADDVPTLIFDEIDAGIGGRIGAVVGRKLRQLSERHQVLCVTHLAQVAAYADMHLQVRKGLAAGRTVTEVQSLDAAGRVDELASMLGATTPAARETAAQLLENAQSETKAKA